MSAADSLRICVYITFESERTLCIQVDGPIIYPPANIRSDHVVEFIDRKVY